MQRLLTMLRDTAVFAIWGLGFLALFWLPISLWFEFPAENAKPAYGDFAFYLHAYPHICLFSWVVGSGAYLMCYAMYAQDRAPRWRTLFAVLTFSCSAISVAGAVGDAFAPNMLLFEFGKDRQSERYPLVNDALASQSTPDKGGQPKVLADDADSVKYRAGLFDPTPRDPHLYSASRMPYLCCVAALFFVILMTVCAVPPLIILPPPPSNLQVVCLLGSTVALSFWFPLRAFYNKTIKAPLFGPDSIHSFDQLQSAGIRFEELLLGLFLTLVAWACFWKYGTMLKEKTEGFWKVVGTFLPWIGLFPNIALSAVLVGAVPTVVRSMDLMSAYYACLTFIVLGLAGLVPALIFRTTRFRD